MKKLLLLFLLFFVYSKQVSSQPNYQLSFEETLGGVKNSQMPPSSPYYDGKIMVQDSSVYICYHVYTDTSWHLPYKSSSIGIDVYLKRYHQSGQGIWEKLYGSTTGEFFPKVYSRNDGNLDITFRSAGNDSDITCFYTDTFTLDTINTSCHAFRLDENGSILQKKCYGSNYRTTQMLQCLPTSDGGYLISGDCSYLGIPLTNLSVLIKCDSLMQEQWHYCLDTVGAQIYLLQEVENGNFLINARTTGNFFGAPAHANDIGLAKFSPGGSLLWAKAYGSDAIEELGNLVMIPNGYVFAATSNLGSGGVFSDSGDVIGHHGGMDIWIVQLDTSGNLVKQKCIGTNLNERGTDIIAKPSGGYYISGHTTSNIIEGDTLFNHGQEDCFIAELDANLNYVDGSCYGGSGRDYLLNMEIAADKSIWAIGSTNSTDGDISFNHGSYDMWVFRLEPDSLLNLTNVASTKHIFNMYPNPARNELALEFQAHGIPQFIEISNLQGQVMLYQKDLSAKQSVSLTGLSNGVYVVQAHFASGQILNKKLVIVR